jgi:lysophospholipase L1-like esterase
MCTLNNIHPNVQGYAVIARAFEAVVSAKPN